MADHPNLPDPVVRHQEAQGWNFATVPDSGTDKSSGDRSVRKHIEVNGYAGSSVGPAPVEGRAQPERPTSPAVLKFMELAGSSSGTGGGVGGGMGIIDGGHSGHRSTADHGGSGASGGQGADIQGGFLAYIGAASDSGKGSGTGSQGVADSSAVPAGQDPAVDSGTPPGQATGASLTLAIAIPESATNAGSDGTDTPDATSGDDPAQPGQPPDDTRPAPEKPDHDNAETAEPEHVHLQPGAELVGIIPGPKQGAEGQPGFRSDVTSVYQNPDGSKVHLHGGRGVDADGNAYFIVGGVTSAPKDGSPTGDGAGPESALDAGVETPAPGTITVEAQVQKVNDQTGELETVAEVNETVPPGGHAGGDSGKPAAPDTHPEAKANESTSEDVELGGSPPGHAEPVSNGATEPEAAGAQPAQSPADRMGTGGSEEGFQSFLEGAVYGDYSGNDSWSALAGQTAVGFIPVVGQLGDVRDIAHAVGDVAEGKDGALTDLVINLAAVVPGLDALKGIGKVGKHADDAVKAAKHLDTVGTGAKHASDTAGTAAKHADDAVTGSKHASDPATAQKHGSGTEGPPPGHATTDKPLQGKRTIPNGGTVIDRGSPGRRADDPMRGTQQKYHTMPDGRTVRTFEWSDSNIQRMLDGKPPIGNDGNPMILHHRGQSPHILDEHTATFHRRQSSLVHQQDVSRHDFRPGGRTTADPFPGQRERYWVTRAREYLDRMKSD